MRKSRGVLPTFSGPGRLALSKVGSRVRNTYEIRLALYFATVEAKEFVLIARAGAAVDPTIETLLAAWGGKIIRESMEDHSIYFGVEDAAGEEIDGWVVGDRATWQRVHADLSSSWLRANLTVGREFRDQDLDRLRAECIAFPPTGSNIDDEPTGEALLELVDAALSTRGCLFIQ